jgi:hypothetical protein
MERLNLERLALSTTLMVPGQCICQVFGQPKPLVLIQLEGLVVSLVFRFWGHSVAYESNHFLEQRRRMTMPSTLVSIGNKTTKVKRPRKGWFCVFLFWVLFCGESFFLYFCQAHKVFYHQESSYYLQIKHNRKFLPQKKILLWSWFFLVFVTILKNQQKRKNRNHKVHCMCEDVNIE